MKKDFLGKGWKFPVKPGADSQIAVSEYEQDIKEAMQIILGTAKGERLMRPDFGCGIHDYIFSLIDVSTLTLIKNSVREALTMWEPRIAIIDIVCNQDPQNVSKLIVHIDYKVLSTNNRFNFVYPFFISEG